MSAPGNFVPPEPGGFVPPEPGGFVPPEPDGFVPPEFAEPAAPAGHPAAPVGLGRRKVSRRSADQLGIVWVRGTLHVGVRRQRKTLGLWSSPTPVRTVEEFATALDCALAAVKFEGIDTYLVYEGEHFLHQSEAAPSFSAKATRTYLQSRVDRCAKDLGPVLWVPQPALGPKNEKAFLLHLMPRAFYDQLRRVFLSRRLDLTRIFPMVVPVQREMSGFPIPRGVPALVAAELADATILVVAQPGGPLLFTRTILASLEESPERVAIEINRSLLYARQHFNVSVDRIWLVTRTGRANEEVTAKCGAGKMVLVLPTQPDEWVVNASRIVRTHPVNLIAGYIRRKRRDQFVRLGLMAIGWLSLANFGLRLWNAEERWGWERARIEALASREADLAEERDRLALRNRKVDDDRALQERIALAALPPVPAKLLAHLAALLPADVRLTEFSVRWDEQTGAWTLQCEGLISGDEDSAREMLDSLRRNLAQGPLRIRFSDTQAGFGRAAVGGAGGAAQQRFNLEGTLFEN